MEDKEFDIKEVTTEEAKKIIDSRLPLGKFYVIEDGVFVGIDNEDGEAWTDEFNNIDICYDWLYGENL